MTPYLGWAATAVFIASYFFTRPAVLRTVQMAGAFMWVVYGALIGAPPVVVANVLVFAAAGWTAFHDRARHPAAAQAPGTQGPPAGRRESPG